MPAMDKLGGLAKSFMTPKNAFRGAQGLFQMAGQPAGPQAPPPQAPPPRPAMPPQPVNPMISGRIIRPQRKY
jgi:hypothetical protein